MTRPRLFLGIGILVLVSTIAVGVGLLRLSSSPSSSPRRFLLPRSIPADCSKPVDGEINRFVVGLPNGSTIIFGKNACYAQDGSLEIVDRSALTLDGNGATFKAVTPGETCRVNWQVQGGANITLKNMTVRGTNTTGYEGPRPPEPRGQCQHGYSFNSVQGGSLLSSKAFDTIADPVSIEPDGRKGGDYCAVPPNRNITIDGFYGFNSGRTVGVTHADGVTISNSYFGDIYDNAIDLETDVACEFTSNVRILNNHFGRFHFSLLAHTGSEPPERSSNIEISGNVTDEEPSTCLPAINVEPFQYPAGQFRMNYIIQRNQFKTLGTAMVLTGIAKSKIESNGLSKKYGNGCVSAAYGVELRNAQEVNVSGNVLVGAAGEWAGELLAVPPSPTITQRP